MNLENQKNELYGVLIEFKEPEPLIQIAKKIYKEGFRNLDAFTPYPVEDLAESIGFESESVSKITFIGGSLGGCLGFLMQCYANVVDYPINVGGRPDFSWPAFIPVTFELTVLGAALSAAFGMLALNRLPQLWHPVFNLDAFLNASRNRFFLCIQAKDPLFDLTRIRELIKDSEFLKFHEVKLEE